MCQRMKLSAGGTAPDAFLACPEPSPLRCLNTDNVMTCAILGVLYAATSGATWLRKDNWALSASSTATSYCSFYGISGFTVPCTGTNPLITKMCVQTAAA